MGYPAAILIGYLLGCSNMAFFLSKLKSVELRDKGSRNLGASNATVLLGWRAGILVAVHDIGKAALAVIVVKWLFPSQVYAPVAAGVAAVLGHIFPFYLRFRGGKGFASFWGMTLALNWKLALIVGVLIVLVTVVTDYIVLATTMTVTVVPIWEGIAAHSLIPPLIILIATAVIILKHRKNYGRIIRGEEIGLRSTIKGEHRAK